MLINRSSPSWNCHVLPLLFSFRGHNDIFCPKWESLRFPMERSGQFFWHSRLFANNALYVSQMYSMCKRIPVLFHGFGIVSLIIMISRHGVTVHREKTEDHGISHYRLARGDRMHLLDRVRPTSYNSVRWVEKKCRELPSKETVGKWITALSGVV